MKFRLTLASLLLSFNLANADYLGIEINQLYDDLRSIDNISRNIEFQGLKINLRGKKINHMDYPNFYFLVNDDHNGKPLYWLRYYFSEEDVQSYIKKLQRTSWGRAVK